MQRFNPIASLRLVYRDTAADRPLVLSAPMGYIYSFLRSKSSKGVGIR